MDEVQQAMMARGAPTDPCGKCGCMRKSHCPSPTFSYAKSGGSSGKSHEVRCTARTSCDCKYCLCFCPGFVEPYPGQKYQQCVFAPKENAMPCHTIRDDKGQVTAIICSHGTRTHKCDFCGSPSTKQCDWLLTGEKSGKTCDKYMCDRCATNQGPEIDYCPPHQRMKEGQQKPAAGFLGGLFE